MLTEGHAGFVSSTVTNCRRPAKRRTFQSPRSAMGVEYEVIWKLIRHL